MSESADSDVAMMRNGAWDQDKDRLNCYWGGNSWKQEWGVEERETQRLSKAKCLTPLLIVCAGA